MAEDEEAATTLEGDSYPSPKVTPSYTEEEEVAATPEGGDSYPSPKVTPSYTEEEEVAANPKGDSYPSPKVTPSYTEEERDSYPYSTPLPQSHHHCGHRLPLSYCDPVLPRR